MARQPILEDLNDLYYFAMVAEHGGFSAAARMLDIPKSRLSARVAVLENRLGARLLHRTTRNVTLTELGARFFAHAQASIEQALSAQEVVDVASAVPNGMVRICCPALATRLYLAPHLPTFMDKFPGVRLQVITTDRRVDLLAESIDVAIRLYRPDDMEPDLVTKRLGVSRRILVASKGYMQRSTLSHPEDLREERTLVYGAGDEWQEWLLVNSGGQPVTVKHRPVLTCMDSEAVLNAAVHGLGIAMLPDAACKTALDQGKLVKVLDGWSTPELVLHLVFPSRRYMLPSVRSLVDFLTDLLPPLTTSDS